MSPETQAIRLLAEAVLELAKAVRDAPPPVINVSVQPAELVALEAPQVTVNVPPAPEQAAPVVNVTAEPVVTVQPAPAAPPPPPPPAPARLPRQWRFTRDRNRNITGIEAAED